MQWEEVRKIYPDQYVQLQILSFHTEDNIKFVDDVALIRAIQDPKEATQELLHSKNGLIVSHTANEDLKIHLRALRGLRGVIQHEN
jgi:hemerythrin